MATTPQVFGPDWWKESILPGYESALYYSDPTGMEFAGRSPRRRRFFEESYQDIMRDFDQAAGFSMREGEAPATFQEFLETNPWTARYGRLPQRTRGTTGMMANPRTRFLFNY